MRRGPHPRGSRHRRIRSQLVIRIVVAVPLDTASPAGRVDTARATPRRQGEGERIRFAFGNVHRGIATTGRPRLEYRPGRADRFHAHRPRVRVRIGVPWLSA